MFCDLAYDIIITVIFNPHNKLIGFFSRVMNCVMIQTASRIGFPGVSFILWQVSMVRCDLMTRAMIRMYASRTQMVGWFPGNYKIINRWWIGTLSLQINDVCWRRNKSWKWKLLRALSPSLALSASLFVASQPQCATQIINWGTLAVHRHQIQHKQDMISLICGLWGWVPVSSLGLKHNNK